MNIISCTRCVFHYKLYSIQIWQQSALLSSINLLYFFLITYFVLFWTHFNHIFVQIENTAYTDEQASSPNTVSQKVINFKRGRKKNHPTKEKASATGNIVISTYTESSSSSTPIEWTPTILYYIYPRIAQDEVWFLHTRCITFIERMEFNLLIIRCIYQTSTFQANKQTNVKGEQATSSSSSWSSHRGKTSRQTYSVRAGTQPESSKAAACASS